MSERACKFCGCTEDRACPDGCYWVNANPWVCSRCACYGLAQAGVDVTPLLVGLEFARERAIVAAAADAGEPVEPPISPVPVPLVLLAKALNVLAGVDQVTDCALSVDDVPEPYQPLWAALMVDLEDTLSTYDEAAAQGMLPPRTMLSSIVAEAGGGGAAVEVTAEPRPPRLWRPGDPL